MTHPGKFVLGGLLALGLAGPATAQTYRSAPAEQRPAFGGAVAVADGSVFVGEAFNSLTSGVVYLYRRSGAAGPWAERGRLVASDAKPGDQFGAALAGAGDRLLVTATAASGGMGAAYIFQRTAGGNWAESARLTAPTPKAGDNFGSTAGLAGDVALIGANGAAEGAGEVHVFLRGAGGSWRPAGIIKAEDGQAGDRFGSSVALMGNLAVIGAPRHNEATGAAYVFRFDPASGTWRQEAKLAFRAGGKNDRLGSAVALVDGRIYVGAPRFQNAIGAVIAYDRDDASGEWAEADMLVPFDAGRGQFGGAIAGDGRDLLIGAPGAGGFQGRIYIYQRGEGGEWTGASKLAAGDLERGDFFAGSLAAGGGIIVAGLPGDDYGAGTAAIFERERGAWRERTKVLSEEESMTAIAGGEVRCADGAVQAFSCEQVDLVSFLPVKDLGGGRGVRLNDIWGWTDTQTGKEYAIVGRVDGTSFVDISDPARPVYLGDLPKTAKSPGSTWRDMKVYRDHAFIVADGAGEHGMQVMDLTQLRNVRRPPVTFTEVAHYDRIHSAHNIVINEETGFAYTVGNSAGGETCGGGLHMIDIRTPNRPTFVGCFADGETGRSKTGYSHDAMCIVYRGPDVEHRNKEICFGSNETALSIADVTDKQAPKALSRASYPNVGYAHQGWISDDHRYFFMDDELDEISGSVEFTRTLIWDVSDLDDPVLLKEYFGPTKSSDHNLYVKGNRMYQSNYLAGLRVVDISDVRNPKEVAHFDTVPYGDNTPGFGGSWSNYPFFPSGVVAVTSGREGLFVVRVREAPVP